MIRLSHFGASASIVLSLAIAAPALADGPLSLYAGPQFISTSNAQSLAGSVQGDVAIGYDVGPHLPVPIRARIDLDDSFGNSENGRVGFVGIGASARLTTPIYAGLGLSVYGINVKRSPGPTPGLSIGGSSNASNTSATGFGTSFFLGEKLFSLPGIGVAIEGSYKKIPTVAGVDPSAFGIGVRASL